MNMTPQAFRSLLFDTFRANDAALSDYCTDEIGERFYLLTETMLAVNEHMNLTAITEPEEIIVKHYTDCALLAPLVPHGAMTADIGTGAGFPSLPLAILRPDVRILAVDSTEKKCRYVEETAKKLGLLNLEVRAGRAEMLGKDAAFREQFDVVTARAVARMNVLCEWCLPLVKKGGVFAAMKGRSGEEELREAAHAIEVLGGAAGELQKRVLRYAEKTGNDEEMTRYFLTVGKRQFSPKIYPRPNSQITKKPLS